MLRVNALAEPTHPPPFTHSYRATLSHNPAFTLLGMKCLLQQMPPPPPGNQTLTNARMRFHSAVYGMRECVLGAILNALEHNK